uniref:Uncharacterized protein n=1 Tax=Triticum urartu TaxID=4572 RepID=A0A8R7UP05_TRIUA
MVATDAFHHHSTHPQCTNTWAPSRFYHDHITIGLHN